MTFRSRVTSLLLVLALVAAGYCFPAWASPQVYPYGKSQLLLGTYTWTGSTIKALLLGTGGTYNPANQFVSDISANELSGGSYSRQTLTSTTQTFNSGTGLVEFSSGAVPYASLTPGFVVVAQVIYFSTGTDSTSILISFNDFGAITSTGNTLTLTPPSPTGWFTY